VPPDIRPIRAEDHDVVLEVVLRAFQSGGTEGSEEVDIVRRTWELEAAVEDLDLVAEVDGQVVGHALGARVDLAGRVAVGIAPLSVHPDHQGQGVGSALMSQLLRTADDQGWPLVVLLGSPRYYGRFGFEPAGHFGVVYPPVGAGDEHFQIWRGRTFDPSWRGDVKYCWELGAA
jgi:putative acetyltransferase